MRRHRRRPEGACWCLMVRAGVQVRAVIRVVRPSTARTTVSKERSRPLSQKCTYLHRTIPSFKFLEHPIIPSLQYVINDAFVPAVIRQDTPLSDHPMVCFSLPIRHQQREAEHTRPAEETPYKYSSSKLIINVHTESILRQDK